MNYQFRHLGAPASRRRVLENNRDFRKTFNVQRSTLNSQRRRLFTLLPVSILFISLALNVHAQFPGGGGAFPFGGGGQQGGNRQSSSRRTYPPNGDIGSAIISVAPDSRSLIIIADEKTQEQISQVISNLDRPKPQVLIKVVFLEVERNDASDIGIEGSYSKNIGSYMGSLVTNFAVIGGGTSNATIVPSSISPAANNSTFSAGHLFGLAAAGNAGTPGAGLYQILGEDYTVTLRAIAQSGKARVLSRPSIVARNNQPATITVGQSVPLITNVRYDSLGNAINSVTYQSVGIILRVTPFITSDGMVEMILSPETSDLVADRSQWVAISSGANPALAPLINTRSADTVVATPDGQTVIIGGLMSDSKAETESKVPFLGDIPVLGNLFKRKSKNNSKTELVIFLTPHIIPVPTEFAALSETERSKSDAAKSLTEQELNKFLDRLPAQDPPKAKSGSKSK